MKKGKVLWKKKKHTHKSWKYKTASYIQRSISNLVWQVKNIYMEKGKMVWDGGWFRKMHWEIIRYIYQGAKKNINTFKEIKRCYLCIT